MAFAFNTPGSNNNAQAAGQTNEQWKAEAFINLWVRRADGSRAKLGAIPLKGTRNFDKALIERLQQEGAVEALIAALEVDFQMANKEPSQVNVGF